VCVSVCVFVVEGMDQDGQDEEEEEEEEEEKKTIGFDS